MPLPPLAIGALTLLVGTLAKKSKEYLFTPIQAGASQEAECNAMGKIAEYDNQGNFIACVLPKGLVPNTPHADAVPRISAPPYDVYLTPPTLPAAQPPSTSVVIPPAPGLPERRLPKTTSASSGVIPTNTAPDKAVSVQVSIKNGRYGCLLHEPIRKSQIKIQVSKSYAYQTDFEIKQQSRYLRYLLWIISKEDLVQGANLSSQAGQAPAKTIEETGYVLITRKKTPLQKMKAVPIFGSDSISEMIDYFTTRSLVNFNHISGTVPLDYVVEDIGAQSTLNSDPLEHLKVSSGFGGDDIAKILSLLGADDYPITLPSTLISKDTAWLSAVIPEANFPTNTQVSIPNVTRLLVWFIERYDELMGQWEIPIEVKDVDPTTPGDQPGGFKLPNLAEAVAELFGLVLQSTINSETLVNIATRTLIETGQDKQQNFLNYKLLESLTDFLGYNYDNKPAKISMSFNPGKEELDELLQETEINVSIPEYNEKGNFQQDLIRFREACSIIKEVFFRKVDTNNSTYSAKQQIMDSLKATRDLARKINKDTDQEFDQFLQDAEIGFTNTPGVTDPNNPYGNPPDQRPKIKDLSPPRGS